MIKDIRKLFLSPSGRLQRGAFAIGLACLVGFSVLQKLLFSHLGDGMVSFYVPMVLFFLTLHIILCLFGKRLHDLGYSLWPLIGFFVLVILIALVVSLKFGGIEYFETVMAHPEYAGNEDAMKKVQQAYQNTLSENMSKSGLIMLLLPIVFTLWLVLKPGQSGENRYGLPL